MTGPCTVPLKYLATINCEVLPEDTSPDRLLRYVDIGSVDSNGVIATVEEMRFEVAPSRARRLPRKGDTILSTVRTYLRAIAFIADDDPELVCSTGFAVVRPGNRVDQRFLSYWLRSDPIVDEVCARSVGVSYPALNPSEVGRLPAPDGQLHWQRSVANFLDRKTAAIDELIRKKERLLELLQEKRKALIAQAVTKGLEPTVPMKDSGARWIGPVPAHWQVKRVKHVCRLETGHTPSRTEDSYWVPEECVIPWVSLNDTKTLESSDFIADTKIKISHRGMANSSAHLIEAGAVVFNRDGARVGLAAITSMPTAVSQHIIAWVCGYAIDRLYLLHVIYAMESELYRLTAGATIPTIGMGDVKELCMPVPPLSEQSKIVAHVCEAKERLASAMTKAERQLALLREYRQALITAAVTGQLDIPAEAA